MPIDTKEPNRTRVTKMLCMTANPEEKRKIIGDTFVEVLRSSLIFLLPTNVL